jgi:hypothetical protein
MLSLNQVIKRVETIALNHLQIRNFYFGRVTDFLTEKTTRYASCFMQDQPGTIDSAGKTVTYLFKLYFLDLENTASDTQRNTTDIQSDMLQVATDIIAQIDYDGFIDWLVLGSSNFVLVEEEFDDIVAGVAVDINIQVTFDKDICAVPNLIPNV